MYETIIVALDGSELAERVLPNVQALAEKFNSTLILVRSTLSDMMLASPAISPMPITGVMPVDPSLMNQDDLVEEQRREAREYLEATAARIRTGGFTVEVAQPDGRPGEVIVALSKERGAGLIAMTTHGRGGLSRLFLGSVADEVLRTSACPVLLVRTHEPPHHRA